ncbi:MAG: hypothetical protein AB1465_00410 [Patescibacteria group bacterium]
MIIAFCGIDGSGKSTYVGYTMDYLNAKGLKTKSIHIIRDSFYHFVLHNYIGRISSVSQKRLEDNLRNPKNKIYPFIVKFLKKILLFMNLIYFNLKHLSYKGNLNNNIVCDRYFYDDLVQMKYLKLAKDKFFYFYEKLIIKPDIIFFVKADPQTAYSRKYEYNLDYFLNKNRLYSNLFSHILHLELSHPDIENNKQYIYRQIDEVIQR